MKAKPTYAELEQRLKELEKKSADPSFRVMLDSGRDLELLWRVMPDQTLRLEGISSALLEKAKAYGLHFSSRDLESQDPVSIMKTAGFDPIARAETIERYEHVIASKKPLQYEVLGYIAGKKYYAENKMVPVLDKRKNCTHILFVSHDLTAVKQAEAELKEYDNRYRILFEHAADAILILNNMVITMVNSAACRLMGDPEQNLINQPVMNYIHPEDQEKVAARYPLHFTDIGDKSKSDIRVVDKTGRLRWVQVHGTVIPWRENRAVLLFARDITRQKEMEREIEQGKRLLQKTFDSLTDAVFIIDAETTKIMDCNPAVKKVFGYSPEECLGQPTEFLHLGPESLEEFRAHLYPAIEKNGHLFLTGFKLRHKNQSGFYSEHIVTPLEDEKGHRVAWVSVIRDISRRLAIEHRIRESEARYRSLVSTMQEGLVKVDARWRIRYANQRFLRMTGYDLNRMLGRPIFDFVSQNDMDHARLQMEKRKLGITTPYELELIRADGEKLYAFISSSILKDDGGSYQGGVAVVSDITGRKRAEKELQRLNKSLEEKVRERTCELENLNTALKVLLKKREQDKKETEESIFKNWELVISPFLQNLRQTLSSRDQHLLMDILEDSLNDLVSPFSKKMTDPMICLTPSEVRIAAMVKQGFSSKEIAEALHNAPKTIKNHRENIRKKLGLTNKGINLRTFLSKQ